MAGLTKQKEYDWKDTNLALFGSDLDKAVKKSSAEHEAAWKGIEKIAEEKLLVWRINNFKLEVIPEAEHGIFFGGDSYIVLKISKRNDAMEYNVHFWIGSESTADEYGSAAYKTVELDTYLDDRAIQHREVQDFESDLFLSYFKSIKILRGGNKSGFKKVDPTTYQPRLLLFHIAGKGQAQVNEVALSKNSLDSNDVFILDLGDRAIQWNGKGSNGREKTSAAAFLQQLESDRSGRCKTWILDESGGDTHEFLKHLPDVPVTKASKKECAKMLFRISDASGKMTFELLNKGGAPKKLVTEDDVFIVEGSKGLFVYIGGKCSIEEKRNGMSHAHAYLMGTDHPFAPITVVSAGQKSEDFEALLE